MIDRKQLREMFAAAPHQIVVEVGDDRVNLTALLISLLDENARQAEHERSLPNL